MKRKSFNPGTLHAPLPAVMVSVGDMENSNIITVAWTGILSSEPPRAYISVRPSRHSHKILIEKGLLYKYRKVSIDGSLYLSCFSSTQFINNINLFFCKIFRNQRIMFISEGFILKWNDFCFEFFFCVVPKSNYS